MLPEPNNLFVENGFREALKVVKLLSLKLKGINKPSDYILEMNGGGYIKIN